MSAAFLLIFLLLSPVGHLLIGEFCFETILARSCGMKWSKEVKPRREFLAAYYFFGLLLYLTLILGLTFLRLPLAYASFFSLSPAFWLAPRSRRWWRELAWRPSLNFCLWFSVVLTFGISLLSTVDGIQTPWRNSYGDATWHLGMISSFVFGENLPPENHLFAGATLSYYFFVNLWSAALWAFHPTLTFIHWIFIYQWLIVWIAVFFILESKRFPVLPWTLLFGGGAYYILSRAMGIAEGIQLSDYGPYAHDLIGHGYPWTPFLTTIWVTQRSALFGLPILLLAAGLAERALGAHGDESKRYPLFAGLLLGFSPLVHTHLFLVGVLYLFGLLAVESLRRKKQIVWWFLVGLVPAPFFLPWIAGNAGIVSIAGAWMQSKVYLSEGLLASMTAGCRLWVANAFWWIVLSAFGVFLTKRYIAGFLLALLFLLANYFQVAIWDWDEIKIFLGIYILSIHLWQTSERARVRHFHWLLILLVVPSLTELYVTLARYQRYTIYTAEELTQARDLRMLTEPSDVIAAAPDHNSLVTISGRKMFYGYEGALHANGVNYHGRQAIFRDLEKLKQCRSSKTNVCPQYLLWTAREKKYWSRKEPGEGLKRTRLNYVYRFEGR